MSVEKELANWIFWEGEDYYCFPCVEKRISEINENKEFSEDIDYDAGDTCGYFQDYADVDYELQCCICSTPLYSNFDNL